MRSTWQYLLLMGVVILAIYAPSRNNGFLFEDSDYLRNLPAQDTLKDCLKAAAEPASDGARRPLFRFSMVVQKSMDGADRPVPYRLFNYVLMIAIGCAAYGLLRQPALGIRRIPALLAAMLITVHPVASASAYRLCDGRGTLLALLFILLGASFYLRGGWLGAGAAALCYALALGGSQEALWFPAVLVAAELVGLPGREGGKAGSAQIASGHLTVVRKNERSADRYLRLLPLLLAGVLCVLAGLVGRSGAAPARMPFFEAVYAWQSLAAPTRIVVHQPAVDVWLTGAHVLAGLGLFALVAAAVAVALRHPDAIPPHRKGDEFRAVLFWVVWMAASLPVFSGLLTGGALFSEGHGMAFSVAVWGLLAWAASRFWNIEAIRREVIVVGSGAVLVLAAGSVGRQDHYINDESFVTEWARSNPAAWSSFAAEAEKAQEAGRMEEAQRLAERGLTLKPDAGELLLRKASIFEKTDRLEDALAAFQEAAAASPSNWAVLEKMADLTLKLGRFAEAVDRYRKLVGDQPENSAVKAKLEEARKIENGRGL
jgi:hypothetical protein